MSPAAPLLLRWYRHHGRDLPWRKTRESYPILVSEIMLQQTQVPRVLLFYRAWLKQFPDWKALARASNAEVIRAWAGLGYNRRALVLRDIAREIERIGEPKSETDWRALKGIGPYTAAALAAFSLHKRVLPIDTNIRRVGGRLLLGIPFPQPKNDDRLRKAAERFLPKRGRFFDIPQALFDLATSICIKTPRCAECPMRSVCPAATKFLSGTLRTPARLTPVAHERRHRNKPYPDRIYRGRILQLIRTATIPVAISSLGKKIDPNFHPQDDQLWLVRMLSRMEKDGLIERQKNRVQLPSASVSKIS